MDQKLIRLNGMLRINHNLQHQMPKHRRLLVSLLFGSIYRSTESAKASKKIKINKKILLNYFHLAFVRNMFQNDIKFYGKAYIV